MGVYAVAMGLFHRILCDLVTASFHLPCTLSLLSPYTKILLLILSLSPPTSARIVSLESSGVPDNQIQEGCHILVMLFGFFYVIFLSPQLNCKPLQVREYKAYKKYSINVFKQMPHLLCPLNPLSCSQNFLVAAVGDVVKTLLMLFMGSQVEEGKEIF